MRDHLGKWKLYRHFVLLKFDFIEGELVINKFHMCTTTWGVLL